MGGRVSCFSVVVLEWARVKSVDSGSELNCTAKHVINRVLVHLAVLDKQLLYVIKEAIVLGVLSALSALKNDEVLVPLIRSHDVLDSIVYAA